MMRVFRSPEEVREWEPSRPLWATLGTFDGLHQGHRYLIFELMERARQWPPPAVSLVITFQLHPKVILAQAPPRPILTLEHKLKLLEEMGVDATLLLTFDEHLSKVAPEAFVREWLVERLEVSGVLLGYDARFGHKAQGDFALLARLAKEHGFDAVQGQEVHVDGAPVSSTRIREALAAANLETAQRLLGRPYSVLGTVVEGERRGRSIGFPTANLAVPHELPIPTGVYGVRVRRLPESLAEAGTSWGVANLGYRPTVEEAKPSPTLEVHLLDFDADLYETRIEVEFFTAIRGEKKFPSLQALKEQIARDKDTFERWIEANERG